MNDEGQSYDEGPECWSGDCKCPEAAALRRSRDKQGTGGLTKEVTERKLTKYEY